MRGYQVEAGATSFDFIKQVELDKPVAGPGEVLIRIRACSLNYRDQLLVQGKYPGGITKQAVVPLSDGAGEVEAVGEGVTRFKAGDRVAPVFFQKWLDGPRPADVGLALGSPPVDGVLREYAVYPEAGIAHIPDSLNFEEASTLPCAGVTAWNALMEGPQPVRPGSRVLILGTGGVSLLAMQIARAAGAEVIATSSSDDKLQRCQELGAAHGINYRLNPDWGQKAAQLAGADGIACVVETGGPGTLAQSMQAIGLGGEIAMIGVLTDQGDTSPHMLMVKSASLRGIFVGSRAMTERLYRAVDVNRIKPVIDRVFSFEQAVEAYRYQASGALFGKVVITL